MTQIDRSNLMFSLNNNADCIIKDNSASKRVIYTKKGLLTKDEEILILITDKNLPVANNYEVFGHICRYLDDSWCSCLILNHKRLDKSMSEKKFIYQYYKTIIIDGWWSPMNSIGKNDVFYESETFSEAIKKMTEMIRLYSNIKNIPLAPSPEEEMNGITSIQEGDCDFRPLNVYGINLTFGLSSFNYYCKKEVVNAD